MRFLTPHAFICVNPACRRAWKIKSNTAGQISQGNECLHCPIPASANLCECWRQAFAGELDTGRVGDRWLLPLKRSEGKDPIDALIAIVQAIPTRPRDLKGGCPLVNLAQEMSQLDEEFRKRLEKIFRAWQEGVAMALRKGQSQGTVRRDLIPDETAKFLIAMVEGYEVLAKNSQDVEVWNAGIRNIVGWLETLRAPASRKRA
jgi:hypothetical protein